MERRSALKKLTWAGMGAFALTGQGNVEKNIQVSAIEKKPFFIEKMPEYVDKDTETLKTGICQVLTEPWDLENNLRRTLNAIDEAAEKGAEIAITPECVIHGYAWDESLGKSDAFREKLFGIAEDPEGEALNRIKKRASKHGIYIMIGFVERGQNNRIHNTAALISPNGKYIYLYRKVHCRHFESIEHWGFFTAGDQFYSEKLDFGGRQFNVGTMICFDREIPESFRCLRAMGAELILCPLATDTNDLLQFKNRADNELITRIGSASNEVFMVVVNHAGRFNGGSFISGPLGEVYCQLSEKPEVVVYELPVGAVVRKFHNDPLGWMGWGYRREDIYRKYM